jgi:amino acid adenylation domain-containing protein
MKASPAESPEVKIDPSGNACTFTQPADRDPATSEQPLIDDAERNKTLFEWNDTYRERLHDLSLHELIEAQVERTPDAVAVVFEGECLTFCELNRRANRLAHRLRKLGVGPEVIVGVFAERSVEMVVGLLATLKAGGAYLPLDPGHPPDRLSFMLNDAKPKTLLAQRSLAGMLASDPGEVVILEEDFGAESDANPTNNTQPENLAYVIYTSGSTGQPKGVMNTHRGICNWLLWLQETYALTTGDRILQKTAFTFDVSLGEIFWSLIAGSQLFVARPGLHGDSRYLIKTICENRITAIHFVPSMLSAFLEDHNARRCSSLQTVICAGEALPIELQERFYDVLPRASLHNLYGPTEAAVVVTYWKCQRESGDRIVPIGKPVANTQIYILDREMQPVPSGAVGEIHIGGVQVARGYLARPELTAEKFVLNPFGDGRLYKTGDLGRHRNDGAIEYLGRSDHQVKLRGFRVELGEIESVLNRHPAVHGAVVIARQNNPEENRLVAYVAGDLSRLKVPELRASLKAKLPSYMVPSAIVLLEKFPLNLNGKIDRRALPAPSLVRCEEKLVEARNTLEAQLVAIWERALGTEPIGINDNFFEIGGDSLLALRIFTEIQKTMGKNLPLATLFQMPTIEKLADALRQEGWKPNWRPMVAVQPHGSRPPFFCVHGGFGGVLFYGQLARCLGSDQPLYGLQAEGLDGGPISHPTIPSMATYYLSEMRRVQPHGPYLFGGYSFGGVVAFEMAHQLHAIGEEVALLVLFDTLDYHNLPRPHSLTQRIRLGLQGRAFSPSGERLQLLLQRTWSKLTSKLANRLRNTNDFVQVVQMSNLQALSNYRLRPYPGRITLFRAEHRDDGCAHTADNGWTDYAEGGIEIHNVPGEHEAIFNQPNVRVLAEKLDACIEGVLSAKSCG